MKNTRNIIIIVVLIMTLLMAVAYATFASQLTLNSSSEVMGEWDVRIVNIEVENVSEGCDPGTPQHTNTTVTFDSKLEKPGDTISYKITIRNEGTINAVLNQILFQEQDKGTLAINYTTTELKSSLKAGEETSFFVMVEYVSEFTEVPSIKTRKLTGIIEYVQE